MEKIEELQELKKSLGELEDRVTSLENTNDTKWRLQHMEFHHKQKESKWLSLYKFFDDNAELIAAISLFVAVNLVVWKYLDE